MRAILLVLILAVVAIIFAVATGLVSFQQTRPAKLPQVSATQNGVSARGGQTPAFDVETGSVAVGTRQRNVTVNMPAVAVEPANGQQAQPVQNGG